MTIEEYEARKASKHRKVEKHHAGIGIATKLPLVIVLLVSMAAILG